jgi:hypothetical protein
MATPRSLADDLRQRDDAALGRLLRRRPDLVHPVPPDFTALTARATAGPSVARCVDGLDALQLHVLHVAAELTADAAATAEAIVSDATSVLAPEAADACRAALADLTDLALVWGVPRSLRAVHPVRALVAATAVPTWPRPDVRSSATEVMAPEAVDAQAALHAREALALVRDLLDDWSAQPPGILRSGGLALRDFGTARARLHADWARTSLTIEVAHAARLLSDDHEEAPHWVPTDHFDSWSAESPGEQWIALVRAWLVLPRLPSLADEKTQVLSAERDRRAIPVMRADILSLLADLPPGSTLDAATLVEVLDDRQPRRAGELRRLTVAATLREADDLGLTAAGCLSAAARLLLEGDATGSPAQRRAHAQRVSDALAEALPEDVDHVLIQADLTVVAPGPLQSTAARNLRLLADVESRGHATVYRISEDSVRRALDAGWDAETIHALLRDLSRTPVPQPLTYLVDDVARRHGAVRVGGALAYARSDNPEALSAMVADRRLRGLGLHRIAETVVVSQAPTSELIAALRTAGYAPAAESPDGVIVIRRPEDQRTRAPRTATTTSRRPPEDALVSAAVRTLRAGDRAVGTPRSATVAGPAGRVDLPSQSASAIVAALRAALADNRPVWIGYADTDGTVAQQIVDPLRVHAGILTAFDHRTDGVRTFALSRVTGVADLPADAS